MRLKVELPPFAAVILVAAIAGPGCVAGRPLSPAAGADGAISVLAFGAKGNAHVDDTAAFQAALDAAAKRGGGLVCAPPGRYRIEGNLRIPGRVTLEGSWRAPHRGDPPDAGGTVLHAIAGKGDPDAAPFIRMGSSSVLKGLTIFYPDQIRSNPPIPYPWTIQSDGYTDNLTLLDLTLVNPYQAVDLGTYPAGRHFVRNLYGYPLLKGLYVNQCYDVGRLENIHFWPFWDIDPASPLWEFTKQKGTAFIFGKTDGEMAVNLFSIFYNIGMHFIDGPIYGDDRRISTHLPGSGMYTNCYMDVSPNAIRVDSAMENAGVTFINASIMSNVVVGGRNRGPVKFVGCGFWATQELEFHATLEGQGAVIFEACQFSDWDRAHAGVPCIDANNRRLIVSACDFATERTDHRVLRLGPRVRAATVTGNSMPGGMLIENLAAANAGIVINNNAVEPPRAYVERWIVLGPFPNPERRDHESSLPTRAGFDTDFLQALGGEAGAALHEGLRLPCVSPDGEETILRARTLEAAANHRIDLHQIAVESHRVAYAFALIHSDCAQRAYFDFGFNDGGKVWVNGQEVYRYFAPFGQQCFPGSHTFEVDLEQGANPVLVKIEDGGGARWEFIAEIYGENGQPLPTSLPASN